MLVLTPLVAAAQADSAPPKPPTATRYRSFTIPVSVDRGGDYQPVEVHLLVSADQGKTWSTYARQKADASGFAFQARDDGEYSFASRTIDAKGQALPRQVKPEFT